MCTAISLLTRDHYFGRNLDLEYGYHETVTITPRAFPFPFRKAQTLNRHYAMIGMATVMDGYPLYYEATNEHGLSMAGLNFPKSAVYLPEQPDMDNITPFEFIPWILGQCATVPEAKDKLRKLNLINIPFSTTLPPSPLHWIIADASQSIVVEPMAQGLKIYENPVGVLTNEPPFDYHLYNIRNYLNLSPNPATDRSGITLTPFSNGMGGIGLPGDFSSASRFVKAAFVKCNSVCDDGEAQSVSQFFHILSSVAMPRGSVRMGEDKYEITRYCCCCNTNRGIYYYTTYDNSQINAIDMTLENLQGDQPILYPLLEQPQINIQNGPKGR
ncbi:MAG: choloylglycine hydrolase [Oscillospiraceae bacterium]|nr:choloylglycine hydrolase [Oscillospiraceae bacterium]